MAAPIVTALCVSMLVIEVFQQKRPFLKNIHNKWASLARQHICQLENIQRKAARFIGCLKGVASVTQVQEEIEVETLARRKKRARVEPLMKILSNDAHSSLMQDIDGLNVQQTVSHQHDTRSVRCSAPYAFHSNKNTLHKTMIKRTSRNIRLAASS